MAHKSITEAAASATDTLARRNPWALFAVLCLGVLGLVSYGVPRLFANESSSRPLPVPARVGDSPVTRSELDSALGQSATFVLERVRADIKSERDERLKRDEETRHLLDQINQRLFDLNKGK